jgi:CelD/BcsL family acetyltransferase involved in cellulose biosynthesis
MRRTSVFLKFEMREHRLAQASYSGIRLLGGTLLAPQSHEVFSALFQQIPMTFPNCAAIEVKGVPTKSPLWTFLKKKHPLKRHFTMYAPNGGRDCHTAVVPDSFNAYLGAFAHKKRYNLKRQIRRLDDFGDGTLALHRINDASDVKAFQDARIELRGHSKWDSVREISEIELLDLARRGLLLSYVLRVSGKARAVAFGTRFRETLCMQYFEYDKQIGHLSPGTVMQTLIMKDLAEHNLVRRIDYGFGEPRYKMTNDVDQRATVVLIRRGIINRSVIIAHLFYGWLVDAVKRVVRPDVPRKLVRFSEMILSSSGKRRVL